MAIGGSNRISRRFGRLIDGLDDPGRKIEGAQNGGYLLEKCFVLELQRVKILSLPGSIVAQLPDDEIRSHQDVARRLPSSRGQIRECQRVREFKRRTAQTPGTGVIDRLPDDDARQ